MNDKSLYQFHLDLIPNLFNELYFYIPKTEYTIDIIDKIDILKDSKVFNKVFVIDYHKGPIFYTEERSLKWMLIMESRIEKNIFELVEKKSKISELEFQYILDKYFEYVDILLYYSDWMYVNRLRYLKTDEKLDSIFNIQFKRFEKHFKSLIEVFYKNRIPPKVNYNLQKIIDNFYPKIDFDFLNENSLDRLVLKPDINIINKENNPILLSSNWENDKDKSRKPLITEAEAEKVLLEKFFGISNND
ncbi:hypothetical protein [Winogradskyella tangerina]|uniref:hypothetical protein n=1 Tax=Winogradskyella tangerina TaxID=2023240 RepID=UPI000DBE0F43|nr:hypothetical protein [Winogradskyella tangerina]